MALQLNNFLLYELYELLILLITFHLLSLDIGLIS